ncbi:MAG TPA: metalloregulator ArsR/SmtB family transcription factor [Thermoanaerobaculia bacterium]|jgi:DNA-binding transcriptional ArsR family regulator|nr:metalloregulator ArsR/SmtB family transcription factor [Thermoanaerobaculia bacterium]
MPSPASNDVFRAIADPTRRAVLELLRRADRTVSEIAEPFHISQPAISQHLKVLLDAGLVEVEQSGRERRYRLRLKPLRPVDRWIRRLLIDPAGHVWIMREEE